MFQNEVPWALTPHRCWTWTTCKHLQNDLPNQVPCRPKSHQKRIFQTFKWAALRLPLIQDYFKIISRFRYLKSWNKKTQKCIPWSHPITFWWRFAASYFHALLTTILDLENKVKKHAKKGPQKESPWVRKRRQYMKRAACKHAQKDHPQKNHKIRKKCKKNMDNGKKASQKEIFQT